MSGKEPKDAESGGVLHNLTHKVPGVPAHDESRGSGHHGRPLQGRARRKSSQGEDSEDPQGEESAPEEPKDKLNERLNNKGGHGLNNREHERHVLPGFQNLIARIFGKN